MCVMTYNYSEKLFSHWQIDIFVEERQVRKLIFMP